MELRGGSSQTGRARGRASCTTTQKCGRIGSREPQQRTREHALFVEEVHRRLERLALEEPRGDHDHARVRLV
eukprot:4959230-Prymnesium_polylepis.1